MGLTSCFGVGVTTFLSPLQEGETIATSFSFQTPTLSRMQANGMMYDKVILPQAGYAAAPGEPCLPVTGAYILIPPHTTVAHIEVTVGEKQELGADFDILPAGSVQPLQQAFNHVPLTKGPVYLSSEAYPATLYTKVGTYHLRGYTILVLQLHPVGYIPTSGTLFYYPQMHVQVTTSAASANPLFRGLPGDAQRVRSMIANPEIMKRYPRLAAASAYDLLILTTKDLEPAFADLRDYHTDHGTSTLLVTIEELGDTPTALRTYIREAYRDQGIQFVLLGGDDTEVPAANLWVHGLDEDMENRPYTTVMPSDLFYACLDGTFNGDGDNRWGEPTDGEDGGDIDLMAEVYVGRACAGTLEEAQHFVDKTIAYLSQEPDTYLKHMLFAGEYMGDYGIATWGGNYMDQLVDSCEDDGYMTLGIPSHIFDITMLYDRDRNGDYWSSTDLAQYITDGTHVINHAGHSSYSYAMKMNTNDVEGLDNTQYGFIYSQGCMAGGFDQEDCIAEYLTTKTAHGAVAVIMNARYGWFWAYSTDGDSQRYQREFWDAVFGEGLTSIGMANQDSKEDNIFLLNRSCMRWCYYQLNLFGDPTIRFRINNRPYTPNAPTGETSGKKNQPYIYSTTTTDIENDAIYYQWDWGDGTTTDWLGPYNSDETASTNHTWPDTGAYAITVRAKDSNGGISEWSDPLRISMQHVRFAIIWDLFPAWLQPLVTYLFSQ
jgi:hypothetical protein